MKKLLTKIVTLILSCVLFLATLSGCSLITTDVDKDMSLVVATVSIDGEIKEDVYKREMVSDYNSYGYYYVNYYGYSVKDAYELVLKNIVKDKIIVQQAVKALVSVTGEPGNREEDGSYISQANAESNKTPVEILLSGNNHNGDALSSFTDAKSIINDKEYDKLLSEYEFTSIRYEILTSARSLIEEFIDKDEEDLPLYENGTFTARATLAEEEDEGGNEWEIQHDEKKSVVTPAYIKSAEKIKKRYDLDFNASSNDNKYTLSLKLFKSFNAKMEEYIKDKKVKSAIFKLVKQLKEVGLVKSTESANVTSVDDLLELTYFKDMLIDKYQSAVVSKYKMALENQLERAFDTDTLYNEYVNLFKSQSAETDSSLTTYEDKLASLDDSTFLVYNPEVGYGYVANLLIGFNSKQLELLDAKEQEKNVTASQIEEYRSQLLKGLTVKDLRETWVYNGYGKYENGVYTFDDKYVRTDALKTFEGTLYGAKEYKYKNDDGDIETGYSFNEIVANKSSFATFYEEKLVNIFGFENGLLDNDGLSTNQIKSIGNESAEPNGSYKISEEKKKIFTDLIYAYSTDDGSLSENYGYVYSPITSKTKYVKEFADASQKVVEGGAGSYTIVATEFGYHVILCTYSLSATGDTAMSKEAFTTALNDENSFASLFKQHKLELILSNEVETLSNSFITANLEKVTYFEGRYKNLLEE